MHCCRNDAKQRSWRLLLAGYALLRVTRQQSDVCEQYLRSIRKMAPQYHNRVQLKILEAEEMRRVGDYKACVSRLVLNMHSERGLRVVISSATLKVASSV